MRFVPLIPILLLAASSALADAVHVVGTTAPLPGSTIDSLEGGRVVYIDLTGKRRQRGIEEIQSLSFQGYAPLDEAEARLSTGADDEGVRLLLLALLDAPSDASRRWILCRLVAVHDQRNEYPQAVAHLARLLAEDPHPAWLRILPVTSPAPSTPAAAAEAVKAIRRARDRSEDGDVLAALATAQGHLADMEQAEVVGSYSGLDEQSIRGAAPPTVPTQAPAVTPGAAPSTTADDIDALLQRGDYGPALEACEAAARARDRRSMAKLLWQAGEANRGLGHDDEAIIAWTRSGLLFPDAPTAAPSLAAAAELAALRWPAGTSSRRLWGEALRIAEHSGNDEIADRARAALLESNDQGGSRP